MANQLPDFGLEFTPKHNLLMRHQYCAYHNRGMGSLFHRRAIIQALWPEEVLAWHEWSERMLRGVTKYSMVTWLGSGSSGKTTIAAAQAIQWWLEAPQQTAVICCSTTLKMLKLRIWSEVTRLFCAMPKSVEFRDADGTVVDTCKIGYVGELIDSDLMIRWRPGDNKHAIFGLGVNEGSVAEAMSNLVGIHARRMWLILDELQGIREAIDSAKDNMTKNAVFRCLGMGNTDENMKSLLRRASTPKRGWESVDTNNAEEWETDGGVVCETGLAMRFDGRKSPAIANPEKYPYLIGQKHIDAHIRKAGGNLNDPGLMSQCFAQWGTLGLVNTVLDEPTITKFRCREGAVWTDGFEQGAALDPAFEGADRKILQFYKFGLVRDDLGERWVIEFGDWIDVPVDATNPEPIHYQIVTFCREACESRSITADEFALDSTGEGGGLKAIFDTEWGVVTGVEFGGAPSDRPMPMPREPNRTARHVFDRKVSELAHTVRDFAVGNGIRGLSKEAADQACERRTAYKNKKRTVEKKSEMKLRTGESPDMLDACAVAVFHAVERGAVPGGEVIASRKSSNLLAELARDGSRMISEEHCVMGAW